MKFLLDQNLSPHTTLFLRSLGLNCIDMRDVGLAGKADTQIYTYALKHQCVIITFDQEFSYTYLCKKDLEGLILLRLHPQTLELIHIILKQFFASAKLSQIRGSIVVIERHRSRIRNIC